MYTIQWDAPPNPIKQLWALFTTFNCPESKLTLREVSLCPSYDGCSTTRPVEPRGLPAKPIVLSVMRDYNSICHRCVFETGQSNLAKVTKLLHCGSGVPSSVCPPQHHVTPSPQKRMAAPEASSDAQNLHGYFRASTRHAQNKGGPCLQGSPSRMTDTHEKASLGALGGK